MFFFFLFLQSYIHTYRLGGSDYVSGARLLPGGDCDAPEKIVPNQSRVKAALASFTSMSSIADGKEVTTQACMRPCPPDATPIMGAIPTTSNAYVCAGKSVSLS